MKNLEKLEKLAESLNNESIKDDLYRSALEAAMEMSGLGYWIWNLDTGYLFLTWPWLDKLGYKKGDLPPNVSSWINLCHPDDFKKAEKVLNEHFSTKGKTVYDMSIRYKSKSGQYIPLRSRGEVVYWKEDGSPYLMVGLVG